VDNSKSAVVASFDTVDNNPAARTGVAEMEQRE
jgi:hypothetical protein